LTRVGLLGGTFDPPHYGHLLGAQEAAWRLDLERVLFLPARLNPLKAGESISCAQDRCEMVRLATSDNQCFELSRADLDRPGPSYTVDLLRSLHTPDVDLYFIIGSDILPELPLWHAPADILELAHLAVLTRAGAPPPDTPALDRVLPTAGARIHVVHMPSVEISSTDLRARVRANQPIRYLTPPAVETYIAEHGLYRPEHGRA
jgi:nicotinate-nucleotide adenylyltransferase